MTPRSYGWASTFGRFLAAPTPEILSALSAHLRGGSETQQYAWRRSVEALKDAGPLVLRSHSDADQHGTLFEYELPRQGGRRPDVLLLENGVIVVLEFKMFEGSARAAIDQVQAYARDIREYHSESHDLTVLPVVVRLGPRPHRIRVNDVDVVTLPALTELLTELAGRRDGRVIDVHQWMQGEYAPLPTLVTAARLLFNKQPLPRIKRAQSAGIPQAVDAVLGHARDAAARGQRHLTLLTGVPGAGKTLVGLQVVHSADLDGLRVDAGRRVTGATATFLSGNGPLVQVLGSALGRTGKVFVQDMHAFITEYGVVHPDRIPPEHVIVFDEAQRAWDLDAMRKFHAKRRGAMASVPKSEPALLLEIAQRTPSWSTVLALLGTGQEIHGGEEAGIAQWVDALCASEERWIVHGPASLRDAFARADVEYRTDQALTLDTSLRTHMAADLHSWVEAVVDQGDPAGAAPIAARLRELSYPIYVTRSLGAAREYAHERFATQTDARYGLIASSRAGNLDRFGLDPSREGTRTTWLPTWFNSGSEHPKSCRSLRQAMSEFQVQGLELELPIVCWGG